MSSELESHESFIRARLEGPKAEALGWLKSGSGANTLGETSNEESVRLIQAIYSAGAAQVLAVEIDDYEGFQNTGKLVIALPTDPDARKAVFIWHAEQAESMGFDGERDIGQTHLFSMLD